jgi:hypothetical protein
MLKTATFATLPVLTLLFCACPAWAAAPPPAKANEQPTGAKPQGKTVEVMVVLSDAETARIDRALRIGKLKLTGDRVTNASLKIVPSLAPIRVLSIEFSQITNSGLGILKDAANVQSLRLWQSTFTDSALKHVNKIACLESLDIEGTDIGGEELEQLAELPKLRCLTLGPATENAQLAALGKLAALRELDLRGCRKLGDAGLTHLQGLTNLQALWLPPQITGEGEGQLQQKLPNCKIVR